MDIRFNTQQERQVGEGIESGKRGVAGFAKDQESHSQDLADLILQRQRSQKQQQSQTQHKAGNIAFKTELRQ